MLVTHDVKVATKCTRVMYIVDSNIRDVYNIGRCESDSQVRERERALNMHKMNGEVFAQIKDGDMCVTAVFGKTSIHD